MRQGATALLALLLGCSSPGPVDPVNAGSALNLPVIQGPGYTGVIFPADRAGGAAGAFGIRVSSYWTPDSEVIAKLESKLGVALENAVKSPESITRHSPGNPSRAAYVAEEVAK